MASAPQQNFNPAPQGQGYTPSPTPSFQPVSTDNDSFFKSDEQDDLPF
jgi:hypothetical protein